MPALFINYLNLFIQLMKNIFNKTVFAITAFVVLTLIIMTSFTTGAPEGLASTKKIVHGQTNGVTSVKQFESGQEIYVYLPLNPILGIDASLNGKYYVRIEEEGKQSSTSTVSMTYPTEKTLKYLSFAVAMDPKNHTPENPAAKEGIYSEVLEFLSELPPGKHKMLFGRTASPMLGYYEKIAFTVNVTEEGSKKWKEWVKELKAMDKFYEERSK
jgi:hypothetical protein